MRILALGLWMVARSLSGETADPTAALQAKLQAAMRAVNDLNDDYARSLLNDLIAAAPPDPIAAQAYLYLGVIDFNAVDFGHAHEELLRALELDPMLEVPPHTSPKLALVFADIRRKLAEKAVAQAVAVPAGAVATSTDAEGHRSRAWPWVFGAATVVAVGVGIWGWVEVANFESLKSASSPTHPVSPAQAQSSQSAAAVGEPVGIIASVAAAGFATGLALTW
jgi:hypothetical protein